jgi:hypothetical protein
LPYTKTGTQLAVALLLYRRHALCRGRPFTFPNAEPEGLGISRRAKYRVLSKLEQIGLVKTKRETGCAVEVTLLCDWRTGLS